MEGLKCDIFSFKVDTNYQIRLTCEKIIDWGEILSVRGLRCDIFSFEVDTNYRRFGWCEKIIDWGEKLSVGVKKLSIVG